MKLKNLLPRNFFEVGVAIVFVFLLSYVLHVLNLLGSILLGLAAIIMLLLGAFAVWHGAYTRRDKNKGNVPGKYPRL